MNVPYWRLSSLYFFYFAFLGAIIPFWNLYLAQEGLNAQQIGILGAILMGTKIVSPYVVGFLSDRSDYPMRVIQWTNFFALLGFAFYFLIPGVEPGFSGQPDSTEAYFYWLALNVFVFSFFWNGVIAQYEAVTLLALGDQFQRYGSVRVWGSAGFIVAVIALGWLFERVSLKAMPIILSIMLALIWLSSLSIRRSIKRPASAAAREAGGLFRLLGRSDVIAVLLVCFLMKFSYGTYYTFYTIYLSDLNYSETFIGFLWGVSVMAELVFFFLATRIIVHFQLSNLLQLCLVLAALRWFIIAYFAETLVLMLLAQLMHAVTFALYHATAVEWVRRAFGKQYMGQGQALYSAVSFGLGGAVGALVCGLLWTDQRSDWWQICWLISSVSLLLGIVLLKLIKLPPSIERVSA